MSTAAVAERVSSGLERVGLNWFAPMVRLVSGIEPQAQLLKLVKSIGIPLIGIAVFLGVWAVAAPHIPTTPNKTEFLPGPVQVWGQAKMLFGETITEWRAERAYYADQAAQKARWETAFPGHPFKMDPYVGKKTYVSKIFTSLTTVFTGFLIGAIIAVPVGILCGSLPSFYAGVSPFIQIFKPVSPLAWLPIVSILVAALYTSKQGWFEKSFLVSSIVVALCSLWPTLINTAVGVGSIEKDHLNVARVLQLSTWQRVRKIILPSALPYIFTGLRLSLGVGWMVLIAAEMLSQNPGLGQFVWDMFSNGSNQTLAQILVAVFTIGIVGFILDRVMVALESLVRYTR